jgi:hypothetical protein
MESKRSHDGRMIKEQEEREAWLIKKGYWVLIDEKECGPFTLQDLASMLDNHKIKWTTLFARQDASSWEPLEEIAEDIHKYKDIVSSSRVPAGDKAAPIQIKSSVASKVIVCAVCLLLIVLAFISNYHVVTGGGVGMKIVQRESFGFNEIFIDIDSITGMPYIAAKSRYPIGLKVLQRERLIESDDEFKDRLKNEKYEKALKR